MVEYNESIFVSDVYTEPEQTRGISANEAIMQARSVIESAFNN